MRRSNEGKPGAEDATRKKMRMGGIAVAVTASGVVAGLTSGDPEPQTAIE
jgi:hypothetical protein